MLDFEFSGISVSWFSQRFVCVSIQNNLKTKKKANNSNLIFCLGTNRGYHNKILVKVWSTSSLLRIKLSGLKKKNTILNRDKEMNLMENQRN